MITSNDPPKGFPFKKPSRLKTQQVVHTGSYGVVPHEARVVQRWKGTTYYKITTTAAKSLTTMRATPAEITALWMLGGEDPNARQPYQPPIVRGRLEH